MLLLLFRIKRIPFTTQTQFQNAVSLQGSEEFLVLLPHGHHLLLEVVVLTKESFIPFTHLGLLLLYYFIHRNFILLIFRLTFFLFLFHFFLLSQICDLFS
jgi:hypothetical protein